jgi:hypothetical protein
MERFLKSLVEIRPVGAVSFGQMDGQRMGGLRNVHEEHNCMFSEFFELTLKKLLDYVKVKVKQSHYRPGQALRFPGGWLDYVSGEFNES